MRTLNERDRELVSLGAALASSCVPCIQYHVREGRKVGLSDREIGAALKIADRVRQVPARMVLETAHAILGSDSNGQDDELDRSRDSCCQTGGPEE